MWRYAAKEFANVFRASCNAVKQAIISMLVFQAFGDAYKV
jgi:hypothetical protein